MKINKIKLFFVLSFCFILYFLISNINFDKKNNDVVEITYWQFWTGFEGEAIKVLVDKFNSEHKNIKVKMLTISEPWKKILLSIIGGTPPDIFNASSEWLPELASRNALIPLDSYAEKYNLKKDLFIPIYWEMLTYKGKLWALPMTPSSTALFWNKDLFKKSGLDPERPPRSLEELELYSKKLTIKDKDGKIKQIGFLPSWPSWANSVYPLFFNGSWGDSYHITANKSENIKSWKWAQSFVKELGIKNVESFQEEFGNYQGVNNPFYSGKIAIEINGVWEGNFISKFAPKLNWGAALLPTVNGETTTSVICDCILIPRGAKHPDEAFYFINWISKAENKELLCKLQKKFSPLIISDNENFIRSHPNPYIKAFIDAARSKNAAYFPATTAFQLYLREIRKAFSQVMRLDTDPKSALDIVQDKVSKELHRQKKYEKLRDKK